MANIDKIRLSGVTYNIVDATAVHSLSGYWTSAQTTNAITAATSALAETIGQEMSAKTDNADFAAYTAATDTVLGNKADTTAVTQAISEATSGKLDTSVFETYSGNVDTALASKFAGATWNSTDKKIYFFDNVSATGTALAYIDGTDFVKDGFLQSVTIENKVISGESVPCLVFIWNTDAEVQETDIPLSGIFDPSNYYTTAQTQSYVQGYTYDKSTIDQKISDSGTFDPTMYYTTANTYSKTEVNTLLDGKANASTTYTKTETDNAITAATSTKQDQLVSGTNIKTVGGATLLGSGNVATLHASLDGETLVLSES